jgi:hypothetical protein
MRYLDLHHIRLRLLINLLGAIAVMIASGCWFGSTAIKLPADKGIVVDHLRRAGIWNAWASAYSCMAALALFLNFLFSPA